MLRAPEPVLVLDLIPMERAALLALLDALPADDWSRPTLAGDWSVKDIATHLVADDLGRLSSGRDGHQDSWEPARESFEAYIDRRNDEWVIAMRRLSPAVVRALLDFAGHETQRHFESMDPFSLGPPVSWAGPEPAPNWLDLAREFTERWHHQQQIREAVGAPLLDDPTFLAPALATFAFALVTPYREVEAPLGTNVHLRISGPSGGDWTVTRRVGGWGLGVGRSESADAAIAMTEDTAWRMYVGAITSDELAMRSTASGDSRLTGLMLKAFALVS
jgi:uncharacterized protein (TIGR03083 family)